MDANNCSWLPSNASWANESHQEALQDEDSLLRTSLVVLVGAILVTVTVVGNLLVLIAFALDKSIRTISNYFILSLAFADVIIGVISMPLYTVYILVNNKWVFGRFVCKLWLSVDYTVSNARVVNLLVICCDRYLSITRPLTYRAGRTTRKAIVMILVGWLISAVIWTPWIFAWPLIEGEEKVPEDDCYIQFLMSKTLQTQVITIVTAVCAFYAPVTAMCILYVRVYWETRKRRKALGRLQACQRNHRIRGSKSVTSVNATVVEPSCPDDSNTQLSSACERARRPDANNNHHEWGPRCPCPLCQASRPPGDHQCDRDALSRSASLTGRSAAASSGPKARRPPRHDKGDSKALRTLAAILLAFIITWSPYNLFTVMNLYCDCVQGWLYIIGYYLCYINSTINPLCYALCNTQFRRAFYKIMKCAYCRTKTRERNSMNLIIRK